MYPTRKETLDDDSIPDDVGDGVSTDPGEAQALPASGETVPGSRRRDISLADRLFIAGLLYIPRELRPHGIVCWAAAAFRTSRQTLYDVRDRVGRAVVGGARADGAHSEMADRNRVAWAALTLLVVGAMRLRGVEMCLETLLGCRRSLGWLSGLVDEAGQRAGAVLAATDWSGARRMIVSRDELFMGEMAWLLTVDTHSHAIVSGHVEPQVDADSWAVSLALDVEKTGGKIAGLAEDAAAWFPLSVARTGALLGASFKPSIQKDTWHLMVQARQTVRDADRIALKHLETAERKAKWITPTLMAIYDFKNYEAAHERAERAIARADAIRPAVDLLGEALAIVDRRTDRILDRPTAEWYLAAIVAHLGTTDSELAETLAGSIQRQANDLLRFHDHLDSALATWRHRALAHFAEPELVDLFERDVARAWRLRRAITSGQGRLKPTADKAAAHVGTLCHGDPEASRLAQALHTLLDGTIRTSSASETVNSILRAYPWGRRHFACRRTAQNWLNLLVLWHNMRVFGRGKRAGKSPFQWASVTVRAPDGQPTDDWLVALGYATAA